MERLGELDRALDTMGMAQTLEPKDPLPVVYGQWGVLWSGKFHESEPVVLGRAIVAKTKPVNRDDLPYPGAATLLAVGHLLEGNRKAAEETLKRCRDRLGDPRGWPLGKERTRPQNLADWFRSAGMDAASFQAECARVMKELKGATGKTLPEEPADGEGGMKGEEPTKKKGKEPGSREGDGKPPQREGEKKGD